MGADMKALTEDDARRKLQSAIEAAGSIRALARQIGCSHVLVADARQGKRYISGKLARGLGLKRIVHQTVSYIEVAA